MKDFTGDPKFPIWPIGDSPPDQWADKLDNEFGNLPHNTTGIRYFSISVQSSLS